MVLNSYIIAILLGLIQGLTEFIPVSSTGHIIILNKLLGGVSSEGSFFDTFLVAIQLPSIFAVVVFFWKKINPFVKDREIFKERVTLWTKIVVGILPAMVLGLLFDDIISSKLSGLMVIATTLIIYGILFILVEKLVKKGKVVEDIKGITYKLAFGVGIFQCLAMIPGTSRSGATIIGGLLLGLSRGVSAEFSFFLAIPTIFGATLLRFLKNGISFTSEEWLLIGIGSIVSFIVSYIVIKWLMNYLKKRDFKVFGVYRIILGTIIIITLLFN